MTRVRAELRAAAQVVVEVFTALTAVEYRWWPPSIRTVDNGADERIADVRAGTRRVGIRG
jgi:hypothetical protein